MRPLRNPQLFLPRLSPLTVCKALIWSQLDNADTVCEQFYNASFREKMRYISDNLDLAVIKFYDDNS